MIKDANRSISSITYDAWTGQVRTVAVDGKGTVTYDYDAAGNKLRKIITGGSQTKVIDYMGPFEYENNKLKWMYHQEGRVVADETTELPLRYEYFVKDYLGNVRAIVSEPYKGIICGPLPEGMENGAPAHHPHEYMATCEAGNAALEEALFYNLAGTQQARPDLPVDPENSQAAKLTSELGPSILLKVSAGDKARISAEAFYHEPGQQPGHETAQNLFNWVINLFNTQSSLAGAEGLLLQNNGQNAESVLSTFSTMQSQQSQDPDMPKAYLNYIAFDDNMKIIPEECKVMQVLVPESWESLQIPQFEIKRSGYLYAFVSNQTDIPVWFDDIKIEHWDGPLVQETNYYPFGLPFGPVAQFGAVANNILYNSQQLERDEWDNGDGLNWYDFEARNYDVQIGRWMGMDPKDQFASPYLAMGNNPVSFTDPDGRFAVVDSWIRGFVKGFFSTSKGKFSAGWKTANRMAGNDAKIWGGLFAADNSKPFWGRIWEVTSRLTWQAPQTVLGFLWNHTNNTILGRVEKVEYFHGATFVIGAARNGNAVALGSFISISPVSEDNQANIRIGEGGYTTMHEYGHYLQSKKSGLLYLFKYGFPSALGDADWTELDANTRSATYFHKINPNFNWIQVPGNRYRMLANRVYNPKWFEYPIFMFGNFPLIIGANWSNPW